MPLLGGQEARSGETNVTVDTHHLASLKGHGFPLDKEHPDQPALAERVAEHAHGEVGYQHQKQNEDARESFVKLGTEKFIERGSDRLMVEQANDHFFNDGQDDQQHEEG